MDDEDELKDFNLSSRVEREERRRQRERGRLERELERERARDRGEAPPDGPGASRDFGGYGDVTRRPTESGDVELTTHAAAPRPGGARPRGDSADSGHVGAGRLRAGAGGPAALDAAATEALEDAWAAPSGMRSDGDALGCVMACMHCIRGIAGMWSAPRLCRIQQQATSKCSACGEYCHAQGVHLPQTWSTPRTRSTPNRSVWAPSATHP